MSSTETLTRVANSIQDLQADRARTLGKSMMKSSSDNEAKIAKAARDFESILLSQWIQDAERCFASVPGGDSEDGELPGKDAYQGMGCQAIASALAGSGGIGIAKMITSYLSHNNNDTDSSGPTAPVSLGADAKIK